VPSHTRYFPPPLRKGSGGEGSLRLALREGERFSFAYVRESVIRPCGSAFRTIRALPPQPLQRLDELPALGELDAHPHSLAYLSPSLVKDIVVECPSLCNRSGRRADRTSRTW
jgi:hypothetical protein